MHGIDITANICNNVPQELVTGHHRTSLHFDDNLAVSSVNLFHKVTRFVDLSHQILDRSSAFLAYIGLGIGQECFSIIVDPFYRGHNAIGIIVDGNLWIYPQIEHPCIWERFTGGNGGRGGENGYSGRGNC